MSIIPQRLTAGVTFQLSVVLPAFQSPQWCLKAYFRGLSVINFDAAPGENGVHRFLVTATDTALWLPGRYWYSLRAVNDAETVEIEAGTVTIAPDLAAAGPEYDGRGHARRVLEAIEAVLEKRATQDQQRYLIGNRELWRTPIADLLLLRDRYRAEVLRKQSAGAGNLWGRQVGVSFR